MIRNLLYNCWASTWSNEWRLNVEQLCQYADAFNGRKVVLIKVGPNTEPPEVVEAAFGPLRDVEFVRWPDSPKLGEVAGFVEGLTYLENQNQDELLFYAHTKGTKYKDHPEVWMDAIRRWRGRMYDECLRDPQKIEMVLQDHACCGCFKRANHHVLGDSKWHFAGTFWWVRHDQFFGLPNWDDIRQDFYGTEAHLGRLFDESEAYELYGVGGRRNLYAVRGKFRCELCSHEFEAHMKQTEERVKVCKRCFKRRAPLVELLPVGDI